MDSTIPTELFQSPFACFIKSLVESRGLKNGRYRRHYVFDGAEYARFNNLESSAKDIGTALRQELEGLKNAAINVNQDDRVASTTGQHSLLDHYSISLPERPTSLQDVIVEMDLNGRFVTALIESLRPQAA